MTYDLLDDIKNYLNTNSGYSFNLDELDELRKEASAIDKEMSKLEPHKKCYDILMAINNSSFKVMAKRYNDESVEFKIDNWGDDAYGYRERIWIEALWRDSWTRERAHLQFKSVSDYKFVYNFLKKHYIKDMFLSVEKIQEFQIKRISIRNKTNQVVMYQNNYNSYRPVKMEFEDLSYIDELLKGVKHAKNKEKQACIGSDKIDNAVDNHNHDNKPVPTTKFKTFLPTNWDYDWSSRLKS